MLRHRNHQIGRRYLKRQLNITDSGIFFTSLLIFAQSSAYSVCRLAINDKACVSERHLNDSRYGRRCLFNLGLLATFRYRVTTILEVNQTTHAFEIKQKSDELIDLEYEIHSS